MRIKIGSWVDYDFDKEDAKIAEYIGKILPLKVKRPKMARVYDFLFKVQADLIHGTEEGRG